MKKKKSFKKLLIFSIIIMLIGWGFFIYAHIDTHQVEVIKEMGIYKSEPNGFASDFGLFAIFLGIAGIIASFILKTSVNTVDSIKKSKQKKLMKKML